MQWIFSILYEYFTLPKETGSEAQQTRSSRSKFLIAALLLSSSLAAWSSWRLVSLGRSHVNAIRHIKELEVQLQEKQECPAKLKEAQIYLKMCMAPGRR